MDVPASKIAILPLGLCNQIAAGEVVERPSSVVKELVENSLDAWATRIDVVLEGGGLRLIQVQDNGCGILAEDLPLAVARHATSKISAFKDLEAIGSYGFRGEALPSIASVSRFKISSCARRAGAESESNSLTVEFGDPKDVVPCSLPTGTLMEVRGLFENVPARMKFLKSPASEVKRCQEWLSRLALARPDVAFTLKSAGRTLLNFFPNQSLEERLAACWPSSVVESLAPFSCVVGGIRVHGCALRPDATASAAGHALFYVNGRSVSDKTMAAALKEAYKGRMTGRERPQAVVFLEIDPADVDVNVHPAKTEVRFRQEGPVFSAVFSALRRFLESASPLHVRQGAELGPDAGSNAAFAASCATPLSLASFGPGLNLDSAEGSSGRAASCADTSAANPVAPLLERDSSIPCAASEAEAPTEGASGRDSAASRFWGKMDGLIASPEPAFPSPHVKKEGSGLSFDGLSFEGVSFEDGEPVPVQEKGGLGQDGASGETPAGPFPQAGRQNSLRAEGLEYLGQVAKTYLILRDSSGAMLIVDQHAAHEKVLFSKLCQGRSFVQRQILAIPLHVPLSAVDRERWMEVKGDALKLGFEARLITSGLEVTALPVLVDRKEAARFLLDLIAGAKADFSDRLALMSCKLAIKAGDELLREEALRLLEEWINTPGRENCPHGRPAVLRWDERALEKLFKRTL